MKLDGKVAVVTGSSAGIGQAIAASFAGAGATVFITGRAENTVKSTVDDINVRTNSSRAIGVVADLATVAGAEKLIKAAPIADILVNNLGIYGGVPLLEITDEDWANTFNVNVISAARLAKHYAPAMSAKGWGRLIFISSESAQNIPLEMVHYGASKAALQALSRGYAKAFAGTGVTSNAILPGPTATDGVTAYLDGLAQERGITVAEAEALFLAENRPSSLLGRFATPQEVANLCLYVASELSSATTGAALRVDGGVVESIV